MSRSREQRIKSKGWRILVSCESDSVAAKKGKETKTGKSIRDLSRQILGY